MRSILLALCLAACSAPAPNPTLSVTGHLDVAPELDAATWQAADLWYQATSGWVSLTPGPGIPVRTDSCPAGLAACWYPSSGVIHVTPETQLRRAPYPACTIAHELGHAFGLGHSDDPASIMWHAVQTPCQVTEADADALRRLP